MPRSKRSELITLRVDSVKELKAKSVEEKRNLHLLMNTSEVLLTIYFMIY